MKVNSLPVSRTATLLTSTGYGGSGSSAGTNILQEFELIKNMENEEFTFCHDPDGIADIENSLKEGHRLKIDLALKRFLKLSHQLMSLHYYKLGFNGKFEEYAIEFINAIIKCKWKGWWERAFETTELGFIDRFRMNLANAVYMFQLKRYTYSLYEPDAWRPQYKPLIDEYYSNILNEQDELFFLEKVRQFTANLLQEENRDGIYRYILLDQAVPPISATHYARYWINPKILIIDRDPRDLYVINKASWGCGFIPMQTVEHFISWYSATRKPRENELKNQDLLLFLPFESLIYDYDNSLKEIIRFINFSENNHIHKLQYFNPDFSKRNTQVFLQYPDLYKDVQKIEKQLEPYCYSFPENQASQEIKHFLIQKVYDTVTDIQDTGKIPCHLKKHTIVFIFYMSTLYKKTLEIKNRKGIRFLKSLIKIIIALAILPFEFIVNYLLFSFVKTKE
jgi:hypothetical protein